MYSKDQKDIALRIYHQTESVTETIRILGYPTRRNLYTWIAEENILPKTRKEYPVIDDIKGCMIKNGSLGALMSGSGPTVFGIFENDETAGKALEKCLLLVPGSFAKVVHTI